jgi:hypothetical protein
MANKSSLRELLLASININISQPEINYKKVRGADAKFDVQKPYMRPPPIFGNFWKHPKDMRPPPK